MYGEHGRMASMANPSSSMGKGIGSVGGSGLTDRIRLTQGASHMKLL
jgi:hypothetical protein